MTEGRLLSAGLVVRRTLMTHVHAFGLLVLLALMGCQRPASVNVQEVEPKSSAFTGSDLTLDESETL
jgi:hypothetical protein